MMEELYAKFLPQFLELAHERMKRAYETAAQPEAAALTVVVRDLHGIAGEAGLLGLAQIVPIARRAEDQAKRLRDAGASAGADTAALVAALDEIRGALEALGPAKPKDSP
jgi:HPt (histidine-containing phosphotransfer) domain-containing protein